MSEKKMNQKSILVKETKKWPKEGANKWSLKIELPKTKKRVLGK